MKKLLMAACLVSSCAAYAQNSNLDFKYGLKFSNITTLAHYGGGFSENYDYKFTNNTWLAPTFSFIIKNDKNNFHEFELQGIGINESKAISISPNVAPNMVVGSSSESHITVQYQYVQNFLKKKQTRWMPYLGIGVSLEYDRNRQSSNEQSNEFKATVNEFIFIGYVTPGVSYAISKRFFASASVPVAVFRSLSDFTQVKNESTPELNENVQDNDFSVFPALYNFKLSLGLKL